jgi:SnoaL-like polyketide cyclase
MISAEVTAAEPMPIDLVARLTRLWTEPFASVSEAIAAFGETYSEPVRINGTDFSLAELVERAQALQAAFNELRLEPIQQVEAAGRLVLVFWQRGRHAGPLQTPLGQVEATGREFQIRVIDVLTISEGRISGIDVVSDSLEMLVQLEAVRLTVHDE